LTDRLRQAGIIRTPAVEAAIRAVPRHLFLPGVPLEQAYADNPIYTKHDAAGASISAASQPGIVATMLEQLAPAPGDRILEIGAGTGYNAALLATMVDEAGRVIAIDVDEDLVDGARKHLVAAGISNAEIVLGDGALGYAEAAPYDRAIATVGAYEVPTVWLDQLAPHGRLVVPLRLRGTASRSIAFERGDHGWVSVDSQLAVFMPLRGIGDDARRIIPLTPEQDVTLQVHSDQHVEADAIAGIFDTDRYETWTGVTFPANVSFEWLELWLCLRLDNALMRMNVQPAAKDRSQVWPMFGWGSMATTHGRNLAYLSIRPIEPGAGGAKLYEVGVIAHGPTSDRLAAQVTGEIQIWNHEWRARTVRFELPDVPGIADPSRGRFLLDRPHHSITVTWK
jgi:protein-L-isoaspartate(D-aspartate) O-methyltransferase